jgi:HlyD family secretion protein
MTASAVITVAVVENVLLAPNEALRWAPEDADEPRRGGAAVRIEAGEGGPSDGAPAEGEGGEGEDERAGELWRLVEGEPVALPVRMGPTDGNVTVVSGDGLEEGLEVIVDTDISL